MDDVIPEGVAFVPVPTPVVTRHVAFVLLPNFSLLAFTSALEVLRIANQLTRQPLFRWHVLSENGAPVRCSGGLEIGVDGALPDDSPAELLMVCGGIRPMASVSTKIAGWVRRHWRRGLRVGGLCTGAYTLARAGILGGRRFTLHWENIGPFREAFPGLVPVEEMYCIDDRILTCAGGAAATDLFAEVVARDHGPRLADAILRMCLHGHHRPSDLGQRPSHASTLPGRHPALAELLSHIERNLRDDLSVTELAGRVGLSRRQLERLFTTHTGMAPKQYIDGLRLEHGRALLSESDLSLTEITDAVGYASATAFSRAFRRRYGQAPNRLGLRGTRG